MVVIDTNIIIDHLRQIGRGGSLFEKLVREHAKSDLAMSVISVQELFEGKSTENNNKLKNLLSTIAPLNVLPYTFEVAELAGQIARDSSQTMEFADAAIAASAIINGGELFTLNKKDFVNVSDLELFEL